jgi:hypothetical protein
VELAAEHAEAAELLRRYIEGARVPWRIWLAFGTGVG